jgi:predicted GNAT family acetyltransferase
VDIDVTDNPDASRYEARSGSDLAGFSEYRLRDGLVVFTHTVVDEAFEGQGVGSALARRALDEARERGLQVQPQCSFIRGWIDEHPDYAGLVAG